SFFFASLRPCAFALKKRAKKKQALLLVELAMEKVFQFGDGGGGVVAFGVDGQFAAGTRGEHHQAHDAFAVHLFAILLDEDVATETVGDLDEHRGGTRVDAQLVGNKKLFSHQRSALRHFLCAHVLQKYV